MMETSVSSSEHSKNMKNNLKLSSSYKESCHGCIYFLSDSNRCNWFYIVGNKYSRPIPETVINNGCKKRVARIKGFNDPTGIIEYIIDKFQGEII